MENTMAKIIFQNTKVIETDYFTIEQDWEIPIPAFFILASKRKIRSIAEFTKEEQKEFITLLCTLRKGMQEVLNIKDVYFFQNEDTEYDFHFWIFPRHEWMEPFGRKIQSVRPIMNHAKEKMRADKIKKQVEADVKKNEGVYTKLFIE